MGNGQWEEEAGEGSVSSSGMRMGRAAMVEALLCPSRGREENTITLLRVALRPRGRGLRCTRSDIPRPLSGPEERGWCT